jgi:hypothetical protein
LIKAIARSDHHAMAVLYRRHHARAYRFAAGILFDRLAGPSWLAPEIVLICHGGAPLIRDGTDDVSFCRIAP